MKLDVVAAAVALFVVLPIAGFFVVRARARSLRRRAAFALAAGALFAAGAWGFARGEALGFFEGFEETMLGVACFTLAHLVLAGVADGWIGTRPGWDAQPRLLRRGVTAGLISVALASVFLWPQID